MSAQQLTIDGREEPVRAPASPVPTFEQAALFAAPQTVRGQLVIDRGRDGEG